MLSKIKILFAFILLSDFCLAQIPILNSYPAITNKVVYLDFDGQVVSGTGWNSGNTINALPSTKNNASIIEIWKRISEDYRPFDVNITTDSVRFNSAPPNRRIRVVVTPTSSWYGSAGGVAYVGSFTWGGTPGTPCWVFENQLGNSTKNIAEAASHEVGHTLTLRHQSTYSSVTCSKTAEYNAGINSGGVITWAPIMGVGYSRNVTTWYNGKSSTSCTLTQNDHGNASPGLTGPNYLTFLPDDVGNTPGASKILNLNTLNLADSGLVEQPSDIDAFQFSICNTRNITIDVKPWALDTTNYSGANLDVRLFLYDASNNQLAVDTPLNKLNSRIGMTLLAGTYWFAIDGGGSPNYSDYGSLGRYYIKIKATNPPTLVSTILPGSNICAGQTTMLTYTSNGTATQWQWNVNGPATNNIFSVQNPTVALSAGVYTVSLLASSSASPGCPSTVTLSVNAPPSLGLNSSSAFMCPGKSVTLTASGATTYTWMPGSFSGTSQIISPSASTSYTVFGSNGTCSNLAVTTISVSPDFTLNASATASRICTGESVAITANGASNYTINPGGVLASSATFTPAWSTIYVITGQSSGCNKTKLLNIDVSPHYDVFLATSDTLICVGDTVALTASGASNYTINPGGLSGPVVNVTPLNTINYTVTGQTTNNACLEDTTITIVVKECNLVGIRHEKMQGGVRIYPNPAHANFVVEAPDKKNIEVVNSIGQVVYSRSMNESTLRVTTANWPRGIYFVRLFSGDTTVYTGKLVVE